MERIIRFSDRISMSLGLIGGVGVALMLLHIIADVMSRNVLNYALPATIEIVSRYYMVAVAFLPLAWIELRNEMISVEVGQSLLRGKVLMANNALIAVVCAFTYALLAYSSWGIAVTQYANSAFVVSLSTKLAVWPTYFLPPVGFCLASAACTLKIFLAFKPGPVAVGETDIEKWDMV